MHDFVNVHELKVLTHTQF